MSEETFVAGDKWDGRVLKAHGNLYLTDWSEDIDFGPDFLSAVPEIEVCQVLPEGGLQLVGVLGDRGIFNIVTHPKEGRMGFALEVVEVASWPENQNPTRLGDRQLSNVTQFIDSYEKKISIQKGTAEWKRALSRASRNEARLARDFVMSRCANNCELCKDYHPWTLELHHIVPVKDGGNGWAPNLIALCPNCHSILETLKTSIGNNPAFHDWIRDRYGEVGYNKFSDLLQHTWQKAGAR